MSELLKIIGLYAAYCVGGIYLLWMLYLAVMNLGKAKRAGQLTKTAKVLGYPLLIVGYFVDFVVNVTIMTVLMLELPQETTVTARLKRHKPDTNWRGAIVRWFEPLLDPYDPSGDHV